MIDPNEIFQFKIGQWVKAAGTVLQTPDELMRVLIPVLGEMRFVVQERWLQNNEAGTRLVYHCAPIRRGGDMAERCVLFVECQLEPSRSYADDPKAVKSDA